MARAPTIPQGWEIEGYDPERKVLTVNISGRETRPQEGSYQDPVGVADVPPSQYAVPEGWEIEPDARPTSFAEGVKQGAYKPVSNLAAGLESAAEAIGIAGPINALGRTLGLPGSVAEAEANEQARRVNALNRPSDIGQFIGEMAGTLPAMFVPGGVFAQGAAGGAMLTDERDPESIIESGLIGGIGGKIGDKAMRGVAAAVSPIVAPAVQRLKERGVKMTPGQIMRASGTDTGRAAGWLEDRLSGLPFIGDAIRVARERGDETFNIAAVNEVLQPIGEALPKGIDPGHNAVRYAGDTLSRAYSDVLPKLGTMRADEPFLRDLTQSSMFMDTMVEPRARQFANIVDADVRRFFNDDGSIDGRALKEIEERLGAKIRRFGGSNDPDAADLADALKSVQAAVRGMAARQNPEQAARLKAINSGWANLVRVERAAAQGADGLLSPKQLRTAVRQSDSSARKRQTARGDALMQQFAEDAAKVLPSQIADSGTAGRSWTGYAGGAALAPGIPVYSEPGQRAAEWLLTGRQGPASKRVGDAFRSLVPVAITAGSVEATRQ